MNKKTLSILLIIACLLLIYPLVYMCLCADAAIRWNDIRYATEVISILVLILSNLTLIIISILILYKAHIDFSLSKTKEILQKKFEEKKIKSQLKKKEKLEKELAKINQTQDTII